MSLARPFTVINMICEKPQLIIRYLKDLWNYIDWAVFILLLVYFFVYHDQPDSNANKVIAPMSLVFVYYRNFSHLRVIDQFTTLVGMINIIIQKLVFFFIIMIYFYIASAFLMIRLLPEQSKLTSFRTAYLWTLFGAIEEEDFASGCFVTIAILFGTIIVTIILLNILIAYLSNVFSRLEDQQKVNDLKEKASMIQDMEIILWFFKFRITGKVAKLRKLQIDLDKHPINLLARDKLSERILTPEERSLLSNRRKLYIFKTVDFDEDSEEVTIDDNIYKKVEYLSKNFEDSREMNLKWQRKTDTALELIKQSLEKE